MTREAAHYCLFLWTCLFLLFLGDLAMIGILCPRIKTARIRYVMVCGGIILILTMPFINLVLGCGLV
jgi:hypothetical protein